MSQIATYSEEREQPRYRKGAVARRQPLRRESFDNQPLASLPFPIAPFELRKLRKSMSLNQTQFGERIGVCMQTVSMYEQGRWPIPGYIHERVSKIARAQAYRLAGLEPPEEPQPLTQQAIAKPSLWKRIVAVFKP